MTAYRSTIRLLRGLRASAVGLAAAAALHGEPGLLLAVHALHATAPGRAR
jgi:hypothetical protein